jgi:hypothetical protein
MLYNVSGLWCDAFVLLTATACGGTAGAHRRGHCTHVRARPEEHAGAHAVPHVPPGRQRHLRAQDHGCARGGEGGQQSHQQHPHRRAGAPQQGGGLHAGGQVRQGTLCLFICTLLVPPACNGAVIRLAPHCMWRVVTAVSYLIRTCLASCAAGALRSSASVLEILFRLAARDGGDVLVHRAA